MMSSDLVWELTDMANYLMVLPNVIGLVAGSALVVALLKEGKEAKAKK
jgi:Na+/alanine symporter